MYEKETQTSAVSAGKPDKERELDSSIKIIDDFYVQAWDEINNQTPPPNKSLWAKAFAIAQGDEKKTQAKYIEFRVAQLQEEYAHSQKKALLEAEKKAQLVALEAKREAYKARLQSKNSLNSLQPLAEKINAVNVVNICHKDIIDLIEKLGGTYDAYKSEDRKWNISLTLGGEKHGFSNADECIAWLKKTIIPLILEGEKIHKSENVDLWGLNLSKLDDCLTALNRLGFVVTETEKGKWFMKQSSGSVVLHAYSIADLRRIITEADASIVLYDTSIDNKGEDTTTTTHIEDKSNYTNTENKISHPDTLTSDTLGTAASAPSKKHNKVLKTIGMIFAVLGLLIVIAFAGAIGKNIGRSTVKNIERGKLDAALEETLMTTSLQINKQLPMMVDSETRLDTTICAGKHIAYKYTMINLLDKDLDVNAFTNEIKTMRLKDQCRNENMVKMLKLGVQYSYIYQDRNGALLATININKSDCGL